MKSGTPDQQLLIRYLLGELPQEESTRLEQLCLENDALFEELEATEAELTDDYVRGVLVGPRRRVFEKCLLSSRSRAAQVEFARFLARSANAQPPDRLEKFRTWFKGSSLRARFLQMSIATAALALTLAVWVTYTLRHSPGGPDKTTRPSAIATFTLAGGGTRGNEENNEIAIPRHAARVQLEIQLLHMDYDAYAVSLNRVEGERLFASTNLQPIPSRSGLILTIEVPAATLPSGTSILTVTAVRAGRPPEIVGKYVIRARR